MSGERETLSVCGVAVDVPAGTHVEDLWPWVVRYLDRQWKPVYAATITEAITRGGLMRPGVEIVSAVRADRQGL